MMTKREKQALRNFAAGCNCAQAVMAAYADAAGLTQEQAMRLSAGFGGGMGRLRRECGAFSTMVMLACAMEGDGSERAENRPALYARVQKLYSEFVAEMGTVSCAQLLGRPEGAENPAPDKRDSAYYAKRPCASIIRRACAIIERELREGSDEAE